LNDIIKKEVTHSVTLLNPLKEGLVPEMEKGQGHCGGGWPV